MVTYEHADGFFKNPKDLQVWMRRTVKQNGDCVEHNESGEVQRILTTTCQISIELIVNAVSEIGLLKQGALCPF